MDAHDLGFTDARWFGALFEASPVPTGKVYPDGRIARVNAAFASLLGYSPVELESLRFQDITPYRDRAPDVAMVKSLIAGERDSYSMVKTYTHKLGHAVQAHLHVWALRDDAGEVECFAAVVLPVAPNVDRRRLPRWVWWVGAFLTGAGLVGAWRLAAFLHAVAERLGLEF